MRGSPMAEETHAPTAPRNATTNQARALRRRATLTERTLWKLLRDRRLAGLKFRRQVPKGPYVLDVFCFAHGLVVEADGPFHDPIYDAARDRWLAAQGFRVLRLLNRDILGAAPEVVTRILEAVEASIRSWRKACAAASANSFSSREKVAAKPTDEGSRSAAVHPSSDLLRRPPSPWGEGSPARDASCDTFLHHFWRSIPAARLR